MEVEPVKNFRKTLLIPKYLLQGDMFPVSMKERADQKRQERLVKTYRGDELSLVSKGLSQFDLAVSLAYKKIILTSNDFSHITFTTSDFIRALNRKEGGKTRRLLMEALKRSNQLHLSLENHHHCFSGYRLEKFEETTCDTFHASFNIDYLSTVYREEDLCEVDIDRLLSLTPGLNSWLYGFFCSEPSLNTIHIDTLHQLSGSNYRCMSDFKKAVKRTLAFFQKQQIIDWYYAISRDGTVFWQFLPIDQKR